MISTDIANSTALFRKLLETRGLKDPGEIQKYFSSDLKDLTDPFVMKGMTEAVALIQKTLQSGGKIMIHGDYDVDGITSTAILSRTLELLNARYQTFLPDRKDHGYGVSDQAVTQAKEEGVELIITADCGITAHEPIDMARSFGMNVIVIDHHRIPETGIPNATIILNPLQEDCPYPFKELSAGGLAFKLSQALLGMGANQFLDLATLSTICDMAPVKEENRIIVKNGLDALGKSRNPGICALSTVSKIRTPKINVGHVGFMLGPRINAAGRMSSPDIALQMLLTENKKEAASLAMVLDSENKTRQREERQVVKQAIQEAERTTNFKNDRVVVVGRQGWHPGVVGIVAARLVERFHRPALVIAVTGPKGQGSGRSIKGFHLFNALQACGDLFVEYGGHEQAAGFGILDENIDGLRKKINQHAAETYEPGDFIKRTRADLEIRLDDLRMPFVHELELLEPHGIGNPKPVFLSRNLEILRPPESFGNAAYRFWVCDGIATFEAVWRDRTDSGMQSCLEQGTKLDLYYTIKAKTWNGREVLTLEVKDFKPQL